MTAEERAAKQAEKVDRSIKLADQCRRVLKMREFIDMIRGAIDSADNLSDQSIGQEHDRHVGGKKWGRDLLAKIQTASKYMPPDATKPAPPPQYE